MNPSESDSSLTIRMCPRCAAVIPADAPGGLCPACLAGAALAPGDHVPYFGNYELLSELGRGGMGIVWKARQVKLNRVVALKMIRSGMLANDEEVQRFLIEAEAAAQLQHAGIVSIHEIGEHEGQHYFTMDFVDGSSLSQLLTEKPLAPRRAAELLRMIAEAVEYAHDRGILHRDLKPGNVLLDERGLPRLTDFGLAKRLGTDSSITRTGATLGSPSYMSPEQALGQSDRVGVTSDVYALGAVLYEMLTGRPPFRAATAVDTMRQVVSAEPAPPRKLNPAVPVDLETIALKCLEKDPGHRYESAQDVANECTRFLNGEPILARPISFVGRGVKWAKRHPAVAALSVAVAALIIALAAGASVAAVKISRERNAAVAARAAMEEQRDEAKFFAEQSSDQLAESLYNDAQSLRLSDRPGRRWRAIASIQKCELLMRRGRPPGFVRPDKPSQADLRSEALAALLLQDAKVARELDAGSLPGQTILNANGRLVASSWIENVTFQQYAKGELEGARAGVNFHDMMTGEKVKNMEDLMPAYSRPAFSHDAKFMAVPTPCKKSSDPADETPALVDIVIYDISNWQPVKRIPWPEGATLHPLTRGVIFSPDDSLLASNPRGSAEIVVWDVAKGTGSTFAEIGQDAFAFVTFTPDSKRIIFPVGAKKLAVRDVAGGAQTEIPLTMRAFGGAAAAREGTLFTLQVAGDAAPGVTVTTGARLVLDWKSGAQKFSLPLEHPAAASAAAFSSDDRLAFSDGPDIKIFDLSTGRVTMRVRSGNFVATVEAMAWDTDARFLTAVTTDGMVKRWELQDDPPAQPLRAPHQPGAPFAHSPDGEWLAFVNDGDIQLRSRRAPHEQRTLNLPGAKVARSGKVSEIVFRADSAQLAVVKGGRIILCDVKSGAPLPWEDTKTHKAGNVVFAPDGHLIASRLAGVAAYVEDATAGIELWSSGEKGGKGLGQSATVCTDGRHILNMPAFESGNPVRLIELATGRTLSEFRPRDIVASVVRPNAASRIALATFRAGLIDFRSGNASEPRAGTTIRPGDHGVRVFDPATGAEVADYPGAAIGIYSPDDRLLALGYTDGAVELRHAGDGTLLLRWQTGLQLIRRMEFSPDSGELTAGDQHNPLQTLDISGLRKSLGGLKLDW